MNVNKKISILKNFTIFLANKYPYLKSDIVNANLRKVSFHVLKSDFIISIFIVSNIYIINLLKFFFGKKNNIAYSFLFPFFYSKLKEILMSATLLNNSKLKEKYSCKNYLAKFNYYNYIVLGSGPAGSITSYYLNKKFPGKVLLIEKGKHISIFKKKHPHDEFVTKWKNGGLNSTIFPLQISFASGECLGGGSEINSGLFHRPGERFLLEWEKKNKFIVPEKYEIDKHFNDIANIISNEKNPAISKSAELFLKGCTKSSAECEHIPQFYSTIEGATQKNTMTKTFINKFINNSGEIQTGYNALKIKRDGKKKIWKIIGTLKGKKKIFYCKKLFINCGALETSKILISSNLFSKKVSYFKFHPMIKMIVEFDENIQKEDQNVHPFQFVDPKERFIIGEASSGRQFMKINFINSRDHYTYVEDNWKKMSVYHCTFSFGSGEIKKFPFINKFFYTYKINNTELQLIKDSLLKASKILFSAGAKKIFLAGTKHVKILKIDNYNEVINKLKKIDELNFSAVHILGGVTSGEDKVCVVDSYGKVKKYTDLYINDSSLINENLLKNPQGTIMFIAKRNIEKFLNENVN